MLDHRDIPTPSRTQRRVFALMLVAFFALLGWLAEVHPSSLLIAAVITTAATAVSMTFNRDMPLRSQAIGFVIPMSLALLGGLGVGTGHAPRGLTIIMSLLGLGIAMAAWIRAAFGVWLYRRWLLAAMPIGWSIAALAMTLIYYLLLTPVAVIMRLIGRDSMNRRFDPGAATYWLSHAKVSDKKRYFRQY